MGFEYDPDKSAENKRKHGIDFEVAQRLLADARERIVNLGPRRRTHQRPDIFVAIRS